MQVYDFTVIQGDTFDGQSFALSTYVEVATKSALPLVGTTVYLCLDTKLLWVQVAGVYIPAAGPAPIDLIGASATCQFKNPAAPPSLPVPTMKVGTGLFIDGNKLGFSSQKITYPLGTYNYHIETVFTTGRTKTYIKGKMTVVGA